jgi:hypothetical protein
MTVHFSQAALAGFLMRHWLRTLLLTISALSLVGCGATPPSTEIGQGLQSRLQPATRVVISYSELHGEQGVCYEISDRQQVQRLIPSLAARRRWEDIPLGGWSTLRIAVVEFQDAEGASLWTCTLLSDSIQFTGSDGRTWLGDWSGGLDKVMSVASHCEDPATDKRP